MLDAAQASWIFGNLEVGIQLSEFHLVLIPLLRVVHKSAVLNTFIRLALCSGLLATSDWFTDWLWCLDFKVRWRICKVARTLHSGWQNTRGTWRMLCVLHLWGFKFHGTWLRNLSKKESQVKSKKMAFSQEKSRKVKKKSIFARVRVPKHDHEFCFLKYSAHFSYIEDST